MVRELAQVCGISKEGTMPRDKHVGTLASILQPLKAHRKQPVLCIHAFVESPDTAMPEPKYMYIHV